MRTQPHHPRDQRQPHVVIIGGGFGGLYAAKALRRAAVHITLIDRANYHLFQPLLYEVATAALSPADIAAPIRKVFSRQKNVTVLLGRAVDVNRQHKLVHLTDGVIDYDYLIVATGARHSYFGKEEQWSKFAPGLKTVDDALEIRKRFLLAFEAAEREADAEARRAKLTFIVVGAGPTGVELAGTMAELARKSIPRDFRAIDTKTARVILIEAVDRVLPHYPPKLSAKAQATLEKLGVEVRLNCRVTDIDGNGVWIGEGDRRQRINAENVIWAAGVQASSLGAKLGAPLDKSGRVIVEPDLTVPGHPEIFVIGDLAKVVDPISGEEVPGVAPAAIQMGKYVARVIKRETAHSATLAPSRCPNTRELASDGQATQPTAPRQPFHYVNKGLLATIGRGKAVAWIRKFQFAGVIAWLLWVFIHIAYLIGFRNRVMVMLQWAWTYIAWQRNARIITGAIDLDLREPRTDQSEAPPQRTPSRESIPLVIHDGERQ